LDAWRVQDISHDNFTRCNQCRFVYILEACHFEDEATRQREYYWAVAVDMIYSLGIFITIISSVGFILMVLDRPAYIVGLIHLGSASYWIAALMLAGAVAWICAEERINIPPGISFGTLLWMFLMVGAYCLYHTVCKKLAYHRRQIWYDREVQLKVVKNLDGLDIPED
jgi:hypothetical protein